MTAVRQASRPGVPRPTGGGVIGGLALEAEYGQERPSVATHPAATGPWATRDNLAKLQFGSLVVLQRQPRMTDHYGVLSNPSRPSVPLAPRRRPLDHRYRRCALLA